MEIYVLKSYCEIEKYNIDGEEYDLDDLRELLNDGNEDEEEYSFYSLWDGDMDDFEIESIYGNKYGEIIPCLRDSLEEVLDYLRENA